MKLVGRQLADRVRLAVLTHELHVPHLRELGQPQLGAVVDELLAQAPGRAGRQGVQLAGAVLEGPTLSHHRAQGGQHGLDHVVLPVAEKVRHVALRAAAIVAAGVS